jgi:hypothetical protein
MNKETHVQIFTKYSGFLLIIFSLISPVFASTSIGLPGQGTHRTTISVSTQDGHEPVAAIVRAEKVNLRDRPSNREAFKNG